MLQGVFRDRNHPLLSGGSPRIPAQPPRHGSRNPRASATTRSPEAETPPAALELFRPTLLDHAATPLAPLGRRPDHREARNCRRLASCRFSAVLALAIACSPGQAEGQRRNPGADPSFSGGESGLG